MKKLIKIIASTVLLITVLLTTSSMTLMPPGSFYITGEIDVNQGDTEVYTMNPTYNVNYTYWSVTGGSITSQNTTTVTVNWTGTSGYVFADVEDMFYDYYFVSPLNVTITATGPSTPPAPTVQSSSCGEVILARATPPADVTYYWQSSSSGTSTSSSSSTYTRTSGTIYYLRARSSSGTWSSSSSSVTYSIPPAPTWYADTDGDGFGDPATTLTQCTQPSGYVSDNTDACPTEYGATNGCPNSGGTTTYTSDFETGLGDWTQESNEDFDWTRKTGSTGSGGTGPTSANQGSYYIYTEASSPNYPSKTAIITSTSYALGSNGSFSFDYHMYGATMGQLTLSASINGGSSWQTIWSLQGDQGNLWKSAQVDLSSYSGSTVKFRFTGVTGSSYTGDMSIDHIEITSQEESSSLSLSDQNYIYTVVPRDATTNIDALEAYKKIESVTYFDGLGRSMQSVGIHAGGTEQDIVSHIPYDTFGRQSKEYLPIAVENNNGLYIPIDTDSIIKSYYDIKFPNEWTSVSNANPYSEKIYDYSPLNRVLKLAAPGEDWKIGNGHEIEFEFNSNSTNEVKLYKVSTVFDNTKNIYNPTLVDDGFYNSNELYKTITKDEDWVSGTAHTTEEFKDKQGRVILKRAYGASDLNMDGDTNDEGESNAKHDTYYVYDDYGNLSFVLPPKSDPSEDIPNATEMSELSFQYKYDNRNRLIEKKIPGKDWEYIIYNLSDQPVLVQDGNQRAMSTDEWVFTKYDAFGRVAYSGRKALTKTRSDYQNNYASDSSKYDQYEQRANVQSLGGVNVYYSNYSIPTGVDEIYTINYYDDYIDIGAAINPGLVYGVVTSTNVKGLPTVSKVKVLGTNNWITTVTYYDNKGRAIYIHNNNPYLGTTDIVEYDLDFVGNVKESTSSHIKSGDTIVTSDYYTYDHMNRMTSHNQKINNQDEEVIAQYYYDELGQLHEKGVGGKDFQTRLQIIDYNYNIRGWLSSINDVNDLGNDLFGFKINYNKVDDDIYGQVDPLFNGNISETFWISKNDDYLRGYGYAYDDLNRIKSAFYEEPNHPDFISTGDQIKKYPGFYDVRFLNYDKNGNLNYLRRSGKSTSNSSRIIDRLVYIYDNESNKLLSVTDGIDANDEGFKDGNSSGNDYTYDPNGSMITDANKGITSITYNHLNLPTLINFGAADKIEYFYDAAGTKLKKMVTKGLNSTITEYAGNYLYEDGVFARAATPEGYIISDGSDFDYVYQYKDHLGNIRLSFEDKDGNGSVASTDIIEEHNYYPFGLTHKGYNDDVNGVHDKYMFSGKEFDESFDELNTYDFGARNYDPALGRWFVVDALADEVPEMTSYRYGFNNPISVIDPDGNMEEDIGAGGYSWEKHRIFGYIELGAGASLNGDGSISGDPERSISGDPGKKGKKYQSYFRNKLSEIENSTLTQSIAEGVADNLIEHVGGVVDNDLYVGLTTKGNIMSSTSKYFNGNGSTTKLQFGKLSGNIFSAIIDFAPPIYNYSKGNIGYSQMKTEILSNSWKYFVPAFGQAMLLEAGARFVVEWFAEMAEPFIPEKGVLEDPDFWD